MSASQQVLMSVRGNASGPYVPPGFTVYDTYDRANATTLGAADTGQTWSALSNSASSLIFAGIQSNFGFVNSGTEDGIAIAYLDSGEVAQDIGVVLATIGSFPRYSGLVGHYVDFNNFVLLQLEASTTAPPAYGLYAKVGGGYTNIGSSTGITPANGDALRLVPCTGPSQNTFDFWVNGTHFGPFTGSTSSAIKASTKCGKQSGSVGGQASTVRFDNFSVV